MQGKYAEPYWAESKKKNLSLKYTHVKDLKRLGIKIILKLALSVWINY